MLMFDDIYVKRGLWTDWSRGYVMGKTITTSAQTGTVIVSMLAILSSLALTHLWHMISFGVHQTRAQGRPADGLFWQQQAILRTQAAPSSLIAENLHLWWIWRRKANRALLRCFLQLLLPIVFSLGAIAATISTSFVVDNDHIQVLVSSSLCGSFPGALDPEYLSALADATTCRASFVQPFLPMVSEPADCPFERSFCTNDEFPAISMDTGLLDLSNDLGVNLEKSDAIKFRRKITCAVIPVEDRYRVINVTQPRDPWETTRLGPSDSIVEQAIAMILGSNTAEPTDDEYANITFTSPLRSLPTFGLQAAEYPSKVSSNWTPFPGMVREDGHVTVIQIKTGAPFAQPVDDLLFSAHRNVTVNSRGDNVLKPDYPVGLMGCVEQFQYCISYPNKEDFCTELGRDKSAISSQEFEGARPIQLAALELLTQMPHMDFAITNGLNLSTVVMPIRDVSPTQWINEAKSWAKYILATAQLVFSDHAMGPAARVSSVKDFVRSPETDGERALCGAQRLRKWGGFANINLFGLAFVTMVSVTIITVDLVSLQVLVLLTRLRKESSPRLDRWIQDGVLQLQQRAFEAEEKGMWEKLDSDIPVTLHGELLGELSHTSSITGHKLMIRTQSEIDSLPSAKKEKVFVRVETVNASIQSAKSMGGKFIQAVSGRWSDIATSLRPKG